MEEKKKKQRISLTVDQDLFEELQDHYRKIVQEKARNKQRIPKMANVYEDILKAGWNIVKKQKR